MKLYLRPAAEADIRAARDYYDEARMGLGDELAVDLNRLFARLEAFPRSAPVTAGYEPIRRAPLRRFPNAAFYLPEPDRIEVLRIIHNARSSDEWPTTPGD